MLIWLHPDFRPGDWADVQSGLEYVSIYAGSSLIPGPGPETAALAAYARWGTPGAFAVSAIGAGAAFHMGVRSSNLEQRKSRLGSITSSQRYGTFTPSTSGGASAQKTRRAQGLVSRGSGQQDPADRGRERLTPWCRVHKRRHWCRFTRK